MTCSIAPQHIARIPIEFGERLPDDLYLLEPKKDHEASFMVARSVGRSDAEHHVAQVMNTSDTPILLQEGHVLGHLSPLIDPTK
jgi:hypothetical protein